MYTCNVVYVLVVVYFLSILCISVHVYVCRYVCVYQWYGISVSYVHYFSLYLPTIMIFPSCLTHFPSIYQLFPTLFQLISYSFFYLKRGICAS